MELFDCGAWIRARAHSDLAQVALGVFERKA